jgi:hypothetical protein
LKQPNDFQLSSPKGKVSLPVDSQKEEKKGNIGKGDQSSPRILVGSSQKKSAMCIKK